MVTAFDLLQQMLEDNEELSETGMLLIFDIFFFVKNENRLCPLPCEEALVAVWTEQCGYL